jgi:hypothetical protein
MTAVCLAVTRLRSKRNARQNAPTTTSWPSLPPVSRHLGPRHAGIGYGCRPAWLRSLAGPRDHGPGGRADRVLRDISRGATFDKPAVAKNPNHSSKYPKELEQPACDRSRSPRSYANGLVHLRTSNLTSASQVPHWFGQTDQFPRKAACGVFGEFSENKPIGSSWHVAAKCFCTRTQSVGWHDGCSNRSEGFPSHAFTRLSRRLELVVQG